MSTGMLMSRTHLLVEVILHEMPEVNHLLLWLRQVGRPL